MKIQVRKAGFKSFYLAAINLVYRAQKIWQIAVVSRIFAPEIAVRRERGRSLLLFYPMNGEAQIQVIEQKVNALIEAESGLFLVEVKIKPTNNIKVFIDGDKGVSIEKLVYYNRKLYKEIEEGGMYPGGDFSLEVSSPGLDEPLKLQRQYQKNIGRFVEVTDMEEGKKEGKLLSADETGLVIEETKGKGKKMETVQHTIPIDTIKTIMVQIRF
ncbi:MAG: ribosome maturation factor [Chitinophagaceae bacterium]